MSVDHEFRSLWCVPDREQGVVVADCRTGQQVRACFARIRFDEPHGTPTITEVDVCEIDISGPSLG